MAIALNDEKNTGLIVVSPFNDRPPGFLLCDGSAISRSTFSALFAVIGVTYGTGDGSTTFNLPDFKGGVPRGAGVSSGYTENVTVTLGTKQNDQMQGHRHGYGDGANWTDNTIAFLVLNIGNSGSNFSYNTSSALSDGNGTPRNGTETRMKNIGVNFFIKF